MDNASPQPRRLWRVVFVLSLALNVAVIGAVAGLVLSGRAHDGPPQRIAFEFGPLGRVLEPSDRRAITNSLRRGGAEPIGRAEMRSKVSALADALRSDPFDQALVADLLGGFRSRSERVQEQAQTAFLSHLAAMSQDDRTALADKLEKGSRR